MILASSLLMGCGPESPVETAPVSFAVSDAAVGDLDAVVITIDRVTLNRPGDDVVIDSFPDDEGGEDTDTITVDLLDLQGTDYKVIVDTMDLEVGEYQNIRLSIINEDIDHSYVDETGGGRKPIKVPSNELKLGGFEVTSGGPHVFVLEFPLTQAMTYNPAPDRYILKPRGIRVVSVEQAALIEGVVDPSLFDGEEPCSLKPDATLGNVMYLYTGHDLALDELADIFDPDVDEVAADSLIEPYTSENVAEDGSFIIAYLPANDYTLAFSCDAEDDDPELDDGIVIPTPMDQWVEISLTPGEEKVCNFPVTVEGDECG
jgi:hypothetical protein